MAGVALVNVAVITNSLPYTGVTLPLVSFGGSSTVISLIAIGLLLYSGGGGKRIRRTLRDLNKRTIPHRVPAPA